MPTFILIGHCGPDSFMMKSAVSRAVPGATIVSADDDATLRKHLKPGAVLLVNRILHGFGTSSGVELIEQLATEQPRPLMLLVSNLADAQEEAIAAGAVAGFGKRDLYAERTATLLRDLASEQK